VGSKARVHVTAAGRTETVDTERAMARLAERLQTVAGV
jgi:hypothetical protein